MTPAEFIYSLWSEHQAGKGWGEIWAKNHRTNRTTRTWVPWPATLSSIEAALDSIPEEFDKYVTTPIFREQKRDLKATWPTRWVWLDTDNGHTGDYPPSIKLQTGYHTTQAYWHLATPISVPEAVAIGKRLQKRTGADPEGSWICKPLRIPGYLNGKEEYRADPPKVRLIFFDVKRKTSLPLVDESIDETHRYPEYVADHWSEPSEEDRSVSAFKIYGALKRADFSQDQIKEVASLIPWIREKWPDERYISNDVDRFFEKGTVEKKKTITSDYIPPQVGFGFGGAILHGRDKPFLIDGWIREGAWQVFHGNPKTFKSAITHHLAIAVATGTPAFGKYKVRKTGPVLIIDWENTTQTYQQTLWALAVEMCPDRFQITENQGLVSVDCGSSIPVYLYNRAYQIGDEDHQTHLLRAVAELKPALIVIDTLTSCAPGLDVNDILAWQQLQPFLESLCAWNASLLILHHNRKSTGDVSTRGHMMSGTHKIFSWAEGLLSTDRKDDETAVDIHFSGRFEVQQAVKLSIVEDRTYNNFDAKSLEEVKEEKERMQADNDQADKLRVLAGVKQAGPVSLTGVAMHLKKSGRDMPKRRIKQVLDMLSESSHVEEHRSAKGLLYSVTVSGEVSREVQ